MATAAERPALIAKIRALPAQLETLVKPLTDAQLDAKPGKEWTVRQNVHHLPDSHMNAFIRTKLALTEDNPTIRPYFQELWAELPEAKTLPIEYSLSILRGLHERWAAMFESLTEAQWSRTYFHPEHQKMFTLDFALEDYANHGEGHLKQIREALDATGVKVTWA